MSYKSSQNPLVNHLRAKRDITLYAWARQNGFKTKSQIQMVKNTVYGSAPVKNVALALKNDNLYSLLPAESQILDENFEIETEQK